jgi:hypothetical protein
MDVDKEDGNEVEQGDQITKEQLAKTIQKGRSLIKTIRRSQILMMFINNEKKITKVQRRLIVDCMSRWNSTYLSLRSILSHKPIIINLFENKGKLSITFKQREKLNSLELSSDDWMVFTDLMNLFEPFYHATYMLSGSKYPTIGQCLFCIRKIKDFLERDDDCESNLLKTLKRFVLESFSDYFNENDRQHFLLMVIRIMMKYNHKKNACPIYDISISIISKVKSLEHIIFHWHQNLNIV